MRRLHIGWFRITTHVLALTPLAVLIWNITHDQLSFNPVQDITFRTGKFALLMLVLSLACTPLNTVFGFKAALRIRRALGLYAFMYAGLHFLTFTVLDYGLDLKQIGDAIAEKRYVLVGFAAFLLLLPMALTSTKGWMKRMGQNWKRLHKLVYVAGVLIVVHYVWLVKSDIREPLLFGAILAILLIARIPAVRRTATSVRYRLISLRSTAQAHERPGAAARRDEIGLREA
jgi:sulfoxide reductase heme-binding subunit YedZ